MTCISSAVILWGIWCLLSAPHLRNQRASHVPMNHTNKTVGFEIRIETSCSDRRLNGRWRQQTNRKIFRQFYSFLIIKHPFIFTLAFPCYICTVGSLGGESGGKIDAVAHWIFTSWFSVAIVLDGARVISTMGHLVESMGVYY